MDLEPTAQWLFDHGGTVIRCRVVREYPQIQREYDSQELFSALLADGTVNQWLNNLQPYETMLAARQQGLGLGDSGNSSFLHGSTDMNFEVVLPKLAQLGVQTGLSVLNEKTASWLHLLEDKLRSGADQMRLGGAQFLAIVYFYYDYQLIIASSLALAGSIGSEAVEKVLRARLDAVYDVIQGGNYDIYEPPGKFNVNPKEWADHLLKWEIYADGNIKLPFVHDLYGFAYLYKQGNQEIKQKIGRIIQWVIAPEYQQFIYNYGYIRCPDGRGKSVGFRLDLPGYFGHEGPDFNPRALLLRCWLMAQFPESRDHAWFQKSIQHLEQFVTPDGTYAFPKTYLTEAKGRGYWIHGWRMGLGENRRSRQWVELESTFWMFAIRLILEREG